MTLARRARSVSTAALLSVAVVAAGCVDLTKPPLQPAGPPSTPAPGPLEQPYAGSPLSGRWSMTGAAAGVGGLSFTVAERATGAVDGTWRVDYTACGCGPEGVVEAVVDPLEVVGRVVADEDGPTLRDGPNPVLECGEDLDRIESLASQF